MDSLRNALPTLPHRDLSICIAFLITLVAFVIVTLIHRCPNQINRILANLPGRVRRILKRGGKFKAGDIVRDKRDQFIYVVKLADGHQTVLYDAFSHINPTNLDDFERVKTAKRPVKIEKGKEYRLTDDIKTESLKDRSTSHEYKKGAIVKINEVRDDDFVTVNERGNIVPKKMLE